MANRQPEEDAMTERPLEDELLEWLTQEMKFDSSPYVTSSNYLLPSKEDLKILCQGPMMNVWKYVIQNVKSVKTVDHIKKNLAVHRHKSGHQKQLKQSSSQALPSDDNRERLEQELEKLTAELSATESDVHLLEKELDHSKTEVADLELQYQSVCQRVRDLQKKESLLTVASKSAGETAEKYKEYTNRITQRTRDVEFRGTDLPEDERYVEAEKQDFKSLESESCRDVRIACEGISEMLHDTLDGRFTTDPSVLEKAQKELWTKIQKTASSRRIGETVKALVNNTQIAATRLRDETVGLDLAKDAHELSFSYKSSGKLEDISSPPPVQQSVQQLLLASNHEHVLRFFKEQEYKNESWKLEARLDDIIGQIHKHIHKTLAEHPRNVPLAKSYVDSLISAAVERSVVPCLRTVMDGLVERIFKAKREKEELHSIHERIQDFKQIVEKKQNLITVLATHNTKAPERLSEQKEGVLSYLDSHAVSRHATTMSHLSTTLKDSLSSEVDKFSHLLLPNMLSVQLDSNTRIGLSDLSLAPILHPTLRDKLETFDKICKTLMFPDYKSPDRLMMQVFELQKLLLDLKLAQQRRDLQVKSAKHSAHYNTDDVQTIVEMCNQARQHNESQKEKLLPRLEKCLTILNSLAGEIGSAEESIHIWSEQPAQFTTPWVQTEGLTFDQWLHRWRVAVTQVHKMMAQTPHK